MRLRLLPKQVPFFWDAIKFASVQADEVDKVDMPAYLLELLHALLSDKAQCFVRLDENRTLVALLITRVLLDKITSEKYLSIQILYSWKTSGIRNREEDYIFVRQFAETEGCCYVSAATRQEAVYSLATQLGFKERLRTYIMRIK